MIFKRWLKYIIAILFHYSGYNQWVINAAKQHYILMFHRLEDADDLLNISLPVNYLREIIKWSHGIGSIVSMSEIISADKKQVRFCITFDDGFSSVKNINEIAYGIPFILYLSTAYINSNQLFWVVELEQLINACELKELNLNTFNLGVYELTTKLKKDEAIYQLNADLKKLHPADIDVIIMYLHCKLNVDVERIGSNQFLDWDDVRLLINTGMEVGGHTHNHVISSKVTPAEFENEIKISNKLINENTDVYCRHFAYPNGRYQDISIFSRQILIDEGYVSAVSTIEGPNSIDDDQYLLKRFNVSKNRISNPWGNSSKAMFTTMLVNPIKFH